jgi:dipeptidase E
MRWSTCWASRSPTALPSASLDFSIFPHLGHELMPQNTIAEAQRWAADIAGPAYAIDDQTAITVTDGTVVVVSEGHWKLFPS